MVSPLRISEQVNGHDWLIGEPTALNPRGFIIYSVTTLGHGHRSQAFNSGGPELN